MAADFLSLLTSLPSIVQAFGGGTSAPYLKQQQQLAGQQQQISQAMLQGPQNPLYQQMYGQYREQGANQLGQGIAQLQAQNRLNTGMGRTPLFNQERGGEQLFRNLMQGYQGLGTQADQQTRQNLMGAGQATNLGLQGYNNVSQYGKAANSAELTGYNSIYNLLRGGQGATPQNQGYTGTGNYMPQGGSTGSPMGIGSYATENNPASAGINWNQQQLAPYSGYQY